MLVSGAEEEHGLRVALVAFRTGHSFSVGHIEGFPMCRERDVGHIEGASVCFFIIVVIFTFFCLFFYIVVLVIVVVLRRNG